MIDADLLIHNATAKKIISYSADRQPIYLTYDLKNVRISQYTKVIYGTNGAAKSDALQIYFDCDESEPSDFVLEDGMILVYKGKEYKVSGVKASYADYDIVQFYRGDLI